MEEGVQHYGIYLYIAAIYDDLISCQKVKARPILTQAIGMSVRVPYLVSKNTVLTENNHPAEVQIGLSAAFGEPTLYSGGPGFQITAF
jgi:hypothetical protein